MRRTWKEEQKMAKDSRVWSELAGAYQLGNKRQQKMKYKYKKKEVGGEAAAAAEECVVKLQ